MEEKRETKNKEKLYVVVRNRAGPSTPSPTWKLDFSLVPHSNHLNTKTKTESSKIVAPKITRKTLSARKLCANLWEFYSYPLPRLRTGTPVSDRDDKSQNFDVDLPPPQHHQPTSITSLSRNVAAAASSPVQQDGSIETNGRDVYPVSPDSFSSSMKVKLTTDEDLKPSKEVLKMLNNIRSLEKRLASSSSLVKSLKSELNHCRTQVKDLQEEKKVFTDRLERKKKDQDLMKLVLKEETKLRHESENFHSKLSRELSDVKTCFSNNLKELEKETEARTMLETLCNEFAKGIKEISLELRTVKRNSKFDKSILHIAEAWLDDRIDMKLQEVDNGYAQNKAIIESFVRAKQTIGSCKHFENSEWSLQLPLGVKENTLQAKLIEAGLERMKYLSRN